MCYDATINVFIIVSNINEPFDNLWLGALLIKTHKCYRLVFFIVKTSLNKYSKKHILSKWTWVV